MFISLGDTHFLRLCGKQAEVFWPSLGLVLTRTLKDQNSGQAVHLKRLLAEITLAPG